jgi:hypothetical protein
VGKVLSDPSAVQIGWQGNVDGALRRIYILLEVLGSIMSKDRGFTNSGHVEPVALPPTPLQLSAKLPIVDKLRTRHRR